MEEENDAVERLIAAVSGPEFEAKVKARIKKNEGLSYRVRFRLP